MTTPVPIIEKIIRFTKTNPVTGCWEWTGKISKTTGYGHLGSVGKHYLAHRASYIALRGPIPIGLVIDHLCRNRICVNPKHMEIVDMRTNILRGESVPAINSKKTRCLRGHVLNGRNLYLTPDGRRQCKECGVIRSNKSIARKRLQEVIYP